MKNKFKTILVSMMAIMLVACGTNSTGEETIAVSAEPEEVTTIQTESANKTLIVYFSPSNSDSEDMITAATPRVGDTGLVEYLAQLIEERVDADMAMIIPDTAYSIVYDEVADYAKAEQDNQERPTFALDVNPEEYDTIFIGYPIWWYQLPMIMETFFDTYDFSDKTIIPFNAHFGSRDGGTYTDIANLEPNATVLDGVAVSINGVDDAEETIAEWLINLGY